MTGYAPAFCGLRSSDPPERRREATDDIKDKDTREKKVQLLKSEKNDLKKVVLFVCLTAFLFGTMEVALKIAGGQLDSLQMTFLRFFIGSIVLAPFAIHERRGKGKIRKSDLAWVFVSSVVGVSFSMVLFQLGVERCNAATAASLFCLNPLFTMTIAHFFTSEKMNRRKVIALSIGVLAMAFMVRPWDIQDGNTPLGMALILIAAVSFSAYTVMGKRSIDHVGTFTQASIGFFMGSVVLLIVMLATGRPVLADVSENILVVLYAGLFVTGFGYACYFLAIRYSDASTGSIAFFVKPAIAPVLAVVILRESLTITTVIGIVLLITASFITLNRKPKEVEDGQTNEAAA